MELVGIYGRDRRMEALPTLDVDVISGYPPAGLRGMHFSRADRPAAGRAGPLVLRNMSLRKL